MRSAEDVAEIAKNLIHQHLNQHDCFQECIVKALTAYAEERVKEEKVRMFEGEDCCVAALEHDMYLQGRTEALEEAAKVADHHHCCAGTGCALSVDIRALKEKA